MALSLLDCYDCLIQRIRGHDSFSDALERALDMGVRLLVAARLTPMTTRDADVRVEIVEATAGTVLKTR